MVEWKEKEDQAFSLCMFGDEGDLRARTERKTEGKDSKALLDGVKRKEQDRENFIPLFGWIEIESKEIKKREVEKKIIFINV